MENHKIKYSAWRPIGVCDSAPPGVMKAYMFTRKDLEIITAPGINRENWQENKKVVKILRKYARKVAKLSTQTKGMKAPSIGSIKLIGSITHHKQTPGLNLESEAGKVQLFQVEFINRERSESKYSLLLLSLFLLLLILVAAGGFLALRYYQQRMDHVPISQKILHGKRTTNSCNGARESMAYKSDLNEALLNLETVIKSQGILNKDEFNCNPQFYNIDQMEVHLVECFEKAEKINLRTQLEDETYIKIKSCLNRVCSENLRGKLDRLCSRHLTHNQGDW